MQKLALEISNLSVSNMVIQICVCTQEFIEDTFEGNHVCMPKMMLPATQTSCLKDSHANFESYVGIGITYFGER
jgi:hypothetical protein